LNANGMKKNSKRCALCGEKKDKYTMILSSAQNYILCIPCYPRYDGLDNMGKKWLEEEYMEALTD